MYATYLGGSRDEPQFSSYSYYYSNSSFDHAFGNQIAVDGSGAAYVTGWTRSPDFPTTAGAFDLAGHNSGSDTKGDGFVTKLNAAGSGLVYSTYLGGEDLDEARGLALDGGGNLYVTGETISADFPVTGGAYDIGLDGRDAFLTKLNPTGTGLVYSTYLGGGYNDWGMAVAVDAGGCAYVAGTTASNNFPMTSGAWDTTHNGDEDAFIAKLNDTGSSLLYATYLGGGGQDFGVDIGLDGSGNAYVTGNTGSSDFPIVPAYLSGTNSGGIFVTKLNSTGASLLFSGRVGGGSYEYVSGLALDGSENIYLTGYGTSSFMTTEGAYDTSGSDSFALKMTAVPYLVAFQLSKTNLRFAAVASGGPATRSQSVLVTGVGPGSLNWTAVADQGWIKVAPAAGTGNGAIVVGVDAAGLTTGAPYYGYFSGRVKVSDPAAANSPKWIDVSLHILEPGSSTPPFGYFDTPLNGTTGITGAVPVTGWALDDIEVAGVKVYRDPVSGEPAGLVFIGDAVFVEGARPDIDGDWRLGSSPLKSSSGWGYMMLTNMLPNHGNGAYKLYAYARDKEGNETLLGTNSIFCDNAHAVKPFGTIDTPAQGGAVAGTSFLNYAWALTPLSNMIPKNGSTIDVWVDGVNLGHPTYDQYRKDIADNFPGLLNSGGPVGYFHLDATTFTNGMHAIQWVVTDNGGNNDGIGSRYFAVLNVGSPSPLKGDRYLGDRYFGDRYFWDRYFWDRYFWDTSSASPLSQGGVRADFSAGDSRLERMLPIPSLESVLDLPPAAPMIRMKRGFATDAPLESLTRSEEGLFSVEARETDRLELSLGTLPDSMKRAMRAVRYAGYLVAGEELQPLPIGSTLEPVTGNFSWMLGPGFIGDYDLMFVEKDAYGSARTFKVRVTVKPKF